MTKYSYDTYGKARGQKFKGFKMKKAIKEVSW